MIKCINCGNSRHIYKNCKSPITSSGVININEEGKILMICRKKTLGYVDFIRGKYSLYNVEQLKNLIFEMTITEKEDILTKSFNDLWTDLWISPLDGGSEETISRDKFTLIKHGNPDKNIVKLEQLVKECSSQWTEPEWGFPKGRRNPYENDFVCALREYEEETGYDKRDLTIIKNILPYEEIFTGSNYKSYKHKYFIAKSNRSTQKKPFQESEVSDLKWFTFEEAIQKIRPYNIERIHIIELVKHTLLDYIVL